MTAFGNAVMRPKARPLTELIHLARARGIAPERS
jgi:hypothetical protein